MGGLGEGCLDSVGGGGGFVMSLTSLGLVSR